MVHVKLGRLCALFSRWRVGIECVIPEGSVYIQSFKTVYNKSANAHM